MIVCVLLFIIKRCVVILSWLMMLIMMVLVDVVVIVIDGMKFFELIAIKCLVWASSVDIDVIHIDVVVIVVDVVGGEVVATAAVFNCVVQEQVLATKAGRRIRSNRMRIVVVMMVIMIIVRGVLLLVVIFIDVCYVFGKPSIINTMTVILE